MPGSTDVELRMLKHQMSDFITNIELMVENVDVGQLTPESCIEELRRIVAQEHTRESKASIAQLDATDEDDWGHLS